MSVRALRWMCVAILFAIGNVARLAADGPPVSADADHSFRLPDVKGGTVELTPGDPADLTVICFLGTECPLARLYGRRLAEMVDAPEAVGVRFLGVNSNRQDSTEEIAAHAAEHGIRFPIAKDYGNKVADRYGVTRTPEVFLLDGQLNVLYRGRVDDQYLPGQSRAAPLREDLLIALREARSGKPVSVARTEPNGCLIGRVREPAVDSDVTFTNQVSRILNRHCVECHRDGEIGPFSLTDYDEVIGWADMILETIDDGRMPPWHANPKYGHFANTRHMPDADKQALKEWVAAGTPYGNVEELPEPPSFVDRWQLPREPDLVIEMRDRPFTVPASGTVEYQYYVTDPGFEEDMWITGAQVIPGNRSVVHHCIVFVRPPDGSSFRGVGWLSAYVPGQRTLILPPGHARFVPKGSKLVSQMHYTPNGVETQDVTKVGLLFGTDEEITHEVLTLVGIDQEFEIPPNDSDFAVNGRVRRIPTDGMLLAAVPHMHLRGKAFRLVARDETGRREVLLDVPRYDFNWQHIYQFQEPLPLSSIKELEFVCRFDNSDNNPTNPDPSQYVTWGDQSWEEMALAFFEIARPRESKAVSSPLTDEEQAARQAKVKQFVARFLEKFDANGDQLVERDETPLSLRRFGFRRLDSDGDGALTESELEELARRKIKF